MGLALDIGGALYTAADITRNKRPDVMRHFGLRDAYCGFRASFPIPGLEKLTDLGSDLRILGGADIHAHTPLRIAPMVTAAVRGEA
jgi:hypothetical protein